MILPEIEYDHKQAAEYIYDNISSYLQEKFDIEDIEEILRLETFYLHYIGFLPCETDSVFDIPFEVEEERMSYFVINNAVKKNIILMKDELEEIFELELWYMDEFGFIEPDITKCESLN